MRLGALTSRPAFPVTVSAFAVAGLRASRRPRATRSPRTTSKRPSAADRPTRRSCIRGKQQRGAHCRYPCDTALKRGDAGGTLLLSSVDLVVRPRAESASERTNCERRRLGARGCSLRRGLPAGAWCEKRPRTPGSVAGCGGACVAPGAVPMSRSSKTLRRMSARTDAQCGRSRSRTSVAVGSDRQLDSGRSMTSVEVAIVQSRLRRTESL